MKKALTSIALAACALAASVGAQAGALSTTIDFNNVAPSPFAPFAPLLLHKDEFYQDGFDGRTMFFNTFSNSASAQQGVDLVGILADGSDPSACLNVQCPVNDPTQYVALLNDAAMVFGSTDGFRFSVKSFSASWIGNGDPLQATPGFVRLQGMRNGVSTTATFALTGLDANNQLGFSNFSTGAFGNLEFDYVYAYGFACPPPGGGNTCSSFSTDRAQFGIDNITIGHVPEPASLALLSVAGLAAFRASRRRAV
jgi:hypothetical protein